MGLWSVKTVVLTPWIKSRHFFTDAKMARSSLSKTLIFFSRSESFREKNDRGWTSPSTHWFRQAPIAVLLASAVIERMPFLEGKLNLTADLSAYLSFFNAWDFCSDHL